MSPLGWSTPMLTRRRMQRDRSPWPGGPEPCIAQTAKALNG